MKESFKKDNFPKTITFQKIYPKFTTIDGVTHVGKDWNWCNITALRCSPAEYAMISVKDNGYITSEDGTMYLLNCIHHINWITVREEICIDTRSHKQLFQVWFSDEEVNKFKPLTK